MKKFLMHQDHWTASQLKGKSYEEIANLHKIAPKKVKDFIPMDSEEQK